MKKSLTDEALGPALQELEAEIGRPVTRLARFMTRMTRSVARSLPQPRPTLQFYAAKINHRPWVELKLSCGHGADQVGQIIYRK